MLLIYRWALGTTRAKDRGLNYKYENMEADPLVIIAQYGAANTLFGNFTILPKLPI